MGSVPGKPWAWILLVASVRLSQQPETHPQTVNSKVRSPKAPKPSTLKPPNHQVPDMGIFTSPKALTDAGALGGLGFKVQATGIWGVYG